MSFRLPLLLSGLAALLLACATGPSGRSPAERREFKDPTAESLLANGQYQAALQRYDALIAQGTDSDHWRVEAADAALRAGETPRAREWVRRIDRPRLTPQDRDRLSLIQSRLDLHDGEARHALALLDSLTESTLAEADRRNFRVLRIAALNQLGEGRAAARERVALGRLLTGTEERDRNDRALYDSLDALNPSALKPRPADDPDFRGWLDLVSALRGRPAASRAAILKTWRANHPNHPAGEALLLALAPGAQAPLAARDSVVPSTAPYLGILLPLSGPHAKAGLAVQAGILAADATDDRAQKPPLRFLDSAKTPLETLVDNAQTEGAIGLIGPLVKEDLGRLVQRTDLALPVLALNETTGPLPKRVVAFSLNPEADLDQLAAHLRLRGNRAAALLLPDTPFGQRLGQHFDRIWRLEGGRVLGQASFIPRSDQLGDLARLLPVLPEDSVVVLIADPEDARAITPNLLASISVPVYAAAKVYDGRQGLPANAALHHLSFCDMPYLLDPSRLPDATQGLAEDTADAQRLFAFGFDALRLFPRLWSRTPADPLIDGATGQLREGPDQKIQRQLSCARFERAQPVFEGLAPIDSATDPRP